VPLGRGVKAGGPGAVQGYRSLSCMEAVRPRKLSSMVLLNGGRMALTLRDIQCDPIANRTLNELMRHYAVTEEKSRLVLTKTEGDMQLFFYDLDDFYQLDYVRNQQMAREIEQLRMQLSMIDRQRESWRLRALMAEGELLEAIAKTKNNSGSNKVSELRYTSLKRYLAKRFHPDYAPGQGIEKIVRHEIFKEIWSEVDRLDRGVSATGIPAARSPSAA
jgi:hypothetical protein